MSVCVHQRDEESCPAPAYTCTCSSDIPGAPGSPGPTVCHHETSVSPRVLANNLFVCDNMLSFSQGKPGPRGEKGEKGELGQKVR